MDFPRSKSVPGHWRKGWIDIVHCWYTRALAVAQRETVLPMCSRGLQQLVERLQELVLPMILPFEDSHGHVVRMSNVVDSCHDGSQSGVVVHVTEPAGQLDELEDGASAHFRLVMAHNQRTDPARHVEQCSWQMLENFNSPFCDMVRDIVVLYDCVRLRIPVLAAENML